MILKK